MNINKASDKFLLIPLFHYPVRLKIDLFFSKSFYIVKQFFLKLGAKRLCAVFGNNVAGLNTKSVKGGVTEE